MASCSRTGLLADLVVFPAILEALIDRHMRIVPILAPLSCGNIPAQRPECVNNFPGTGNPFLGAPPGTVYARWYSKGRQIHS